MFAKASQLAPRVCVAAALMWLATRNTSWAEVGAALARASGGWLALCVGLVVIDRALMAWRSVALLRAVESQPRVPLRKVVRVFFVSTFVGTFLPGSIGGDAVRAFSLTRLGVPAPVAVGSVAVDRLLGIVSVLLMAVAGCVVASYVLAGRFIGPRLVPVSVILAVFGVGGTLLLLFDSRVLTRLVRLTAGRLPRLERLGQRFLQAVRQYGAHRGLLTAVLGASLGVQALRSAQAWCLGLALGLSLSGVWYFALIPFGVLAFLLPASVAGIGAGTASFVPLFALAGLSHSDSMALAVLFALLGALGNLPGGVLMILGSTPLPPRGASNA